MLHEAKQIQVVSVQFFCPLFSFVSFLSFSLSLSAQFLSVVYHDDSQIPKFASKIQNFSRKEVELQLVKNKYVSRNYPNRGENFFATYTLIPLSSTPSLHYSRNKNYDAHHCDQ